MKKKWLKLFGTATIIALVATLVGVQPNFINQTDEIPLIGISQKVFTIGTVAYAAGIADYTCNGADDNVQFQAALDALPSGGGKLSVLSGNYNFSASIILPAWPSSRITLQGQGRSTILMTSALADHFIKSATTDRCMQVIIRDLAIDGTSQTAGDGIQLWSPSYAIIENVYIQDTFDDGIELSANATHVSVDAHILNCFVSSVGDDGIVTTSYVNDTLVGNNTVFSCGGVGISLTGGGNQVVDNTVYGCTGTGIYTNGVGDIIANNDVASNGSQNIEIGNTNCIVNSNQITGATLCGLYLHTTADNTTVIGNHFDSNAYCTISNDGTDCIIRDNNGYVTENWGSSTGTDSEQAIAHGLATTPTVVILWNIEDGANPYQSSSANVTHIHITGVNTYDYGWEAKVR